MNKAEVSPELTGGTCTRTMTVLNERGLHARAAAKFVEVAGRFTAEIAVSKGEQSVSGRSILGLMMLAAAPGDQITLSARGSDAKEAVESLGRLIEGRFEEE